MNAQKLLDRIKFCGPIETLSIELLNNLCMSFVSTIPYETLDIFGGKRRILDLPLIYETIVEHNRGGFCIELNSIFYWLISEIGFNCHMCMAYNPPEEQNESSNEIESHMIISINLENEIYVVDVGWGGTCFVYPLKLSALLEEQSQPNGVYRIIKTADLYFLQKKKQTQITLEGEIKQPHSIADGAWVTFYTFKTETKRLQDFEFACKYAQDSHPFCTQNSTVVLQDRYRRIFLVGRTLIEKEYIDPMTVKVVKKTTFDDKQLPQAILKYFGVKLDFDLKPKSEMSLNDA